MRQAHPDLAAVEFYGALVGAGATCRLVDYPEADHNLCGLAAYLDSAARIGGPQTEPVQQAA